MNETPTSVPAAGVKSIARRRPSYGKSRTRTISRGTFEVSWCIGFLAASAYLRGIGTLGLVLDGEMMRLAFFLFVATAPLIGALGAYRILAGLLDLLWPRQVLEGSIVERGATEGGPWTPSSSAPAMWLLGGPNSMRWIVVSDDAAGRVRTLRVCDADLWRAAAPGARVRVRTTGILRHVGAVDVLAPAPPLVTTAPFAGSPVAPTVYVPAPAAVRRSAPSAFPHDLDPTGYDGVEAGR